jgi:hypothetical protein
LHGGFEGGASAWRGESALAHGGDVPLGASETLSQLRFIEEFRVVHWLNGLDLYKEFPYSSIDFMKNRDKI